MNDVLLLLVLGVAGVCAALAMRSLKTRRLGFAAFVFAFAMSIPLLGDDHTMTRTASLVLRAPMVLAALWLAYEAVQIARRELNAKAR